MEDGDNTEDDEDYVPDTVDLGGDPDNVEVKLKVHKCLRYPVKYFKTSIVSACQRHHDFFLEYFVHYLLLY